MLVQLPAVLLGDFLKAGTRLNSGRAVIGEASRAVNRSGGYVRVCQGIWGPGWVEAQLVRIGVRIREGRGDRRAGEYGQRK